MLHASAHHRRLSAPLSTAALAVVCALASARTSEASCGHYVRRLGDSIAIDPAHMSMPLLANIENDTLPARHGGCNGPECRGTPFPPLSLPTPESPRWLPQQDVALALAAHIHSRPSGALLREALDASPASGYPERLERPPNA